TWRLCIMWLPSFFRRFGVGYAPIRPSRARRLAACRKPTLSRLRVEQLEDRLTPSAGDLDPTFGTGGKGTTSFGGSVGNEGDAMALQPDGKIIVVGTTDVGGGGSNFAVARYNADGTLDTTFSFDGKVTTDFGGDDRAFSVAIQADGKIVVAGASLTNPGDDFALARYNPDGVLDHSVGTDGKVTTDFAGNFDAAFGVAIQSNGKIVVAGKANIPVSANTAEITDDFALARYNPDGSPDAGFG